MFKKFIFWQIKRWIIPISVMGGLFLMTVMVTAIADPISYNSVISYQYAKTNFIVSSSIMSAIIGLVFPLFAFLHRFGMRRADFYKQIPFKPRGLNRTILVMGVIAIFAITTICYFTGVGIYFLSYLNKRQSLQDNYVIFNFNSGYLFVGYLFVLFVGLTNFLITSLLVQINKNVFEAIINLLLLELFLSLTPLIICYEIRDSLYHFIKTGLINIEVPYLSFSFVNYISLSAFSDQAFSGMNVDLSFDQFLGAIIYLALAIGSFFWIFFAKEKSSDIENEKGNPTILSTIFTHGGFLSLYLVSSFFGASSIAGSLVLFMMIAASYFFINVLYRRGFKLLLKQWLPMIFISLIGLTNLLYYASIAYV